jgi:hypothetical protein
MHIKCNCALSRAVFYQAALKNDLLIILFSFMGFMGKHGQGTGTRTDTDKAQANTDKHGLYVSYCP